ncbi:ABC transporter substrate-binding protein [Methylobacterium currus]|uniref:ABC transporter substrate-binding protein n=1 Tax=Methylobacterium currus TaxID=2051553 RepID=UPI001E4AB7C4|nr:ABC transporter substrate-binding protein [Methylobacterium currus]UHC17875.1 ABC transporter substrate-binding protein [Methylobacterium currus]
MLSRRTLLQAATASLLPAPALAQPERMRILKLVPQAALTILDPIWTTAAVTQNHGYTVFDTLYGLDADFTPRPQMAAGHQVQDDGLAWRIRLRDGLRFHDGAPVRAIDCIASLKRWAARDTLGQLLAASVDEWQAEDDRTLVIRLKRRFPLMLFALAKPATNVPFIMPERLAATDPTNQLTEMVGSGPYRFVADEFLAGQRAVYARFDGYVPRQEAPNRTSGGKVAHFERVEWNAIPDAATALAALQNGEVDWWEQALADTVPLLKSNRSIVVGNGDPNGYVGLIRFNASQPPFNNPKLRAAILSAVDQSDYMATVTNADPSAYRLCQSFLPCGTPYGQTPAANRMSDAPSIERARALVKESGYAGEKVVIINPADFPSIRPMGQITYDLLQKLGLNVELVETDWGSLLQRRASREPVDKGGWSIFHTWWQAIGITTPATSGYIRGQGASGWFGWYANDTVEDLTRQWVAADTEDERVRLAAAIQNIAAVDVPAVPLGVFFIRTAYRSDLTGLVEGCAPFPWGIRRV